MEAEMKLDGAVAVAFDIMVVLNARAV